MALNQFGHFKFIKLKRCPECKFKTKEENNFEDHTIKNHPMSLQLFRKKSVEEEKSQKYGFESILAFYI